MKSNRIYLIVLIVCTAVAAGAFVFATMQHTQLADLQKEASAASSRLKEASRMESGLHDQYNELDSQYEVLQSSMAALGGVSQ